MKFKINKEVFKKLPNLIVYIPIIYGFDNSKSEKNILLSLKIERDCEAELKRKYSAVEELKEQTYIKSYFACFKEFGEDPIKNMPTHFALAKRVVQGKDLPNINPIVNIYNSVSIKYLTPFGGEDLQTLYGDFELRFANGDEHWLGIGETAPKSPAKGNLIWQDDFDVSTISLNWRQCDRTKLTEFSTDGYFIMDGFKNVNDENLKHAAEEFINIITKNFGGRAEMLVLDIDNPEAEIDFKSKGTDEGQRPKVKGQMNTGLLGRAKKE
jgi:DNA/RNA-binding domain of Phe-tRNA-synthetase-like protein